MAKTQEELNEIKNECETLTNKLKELSDEELKQVFGGFKVFYDDEDPEETTWWEKLLKIFNKIGD